VSANKYLTFVNTPLLKKSFASDSRQQRRQRRRQHDGDQLKRRFAGVTASGQPNWPENMPRRVRRAIVRDMVGR
jgi:hypothetical protein